MIQVAAAGSPCYVAGRGALSFLIFIMVAVPFIQPCLSNSLRPLLLTELKQFLLCQVHAFLQATEPDIQEA